MSSRGILMPVRLTDLVAAPPCRATNFRVALAALVLVVTAFSSVAMVHFAAPGSGGEAVLWREISWPFPRDGWPAGRAFRCDAAAADSAESNSMCGRRSASAIATPASPMTTRSTASPIST